MQSFCLTQPRKALANSVASKTCEEITRDYNSVFDFLWEQCSIIMDDSYPESLHYCAEHGCVITMKVKNENTALEFIAHLKLFHHLIPNENGQLNDIFQEEIDAFIKGYDAYQLALAQ